MKILFVSCVYPLGSEETFLSHCKILGLEVAANNFQWAVIKGLCQNQYDFEVISFPALPCFPRRYKRLHTPVIPIEYDGKSIGTTLSYNTLLGYKEYSIFKELRKFLHKFINMYREDEVAILVYSPYGPIMKAIEPFRKKYSNVKLCSIIADLVDDATNPIFKLSFLKYVQARMEQILVKDSYSYTDKFILLADAMRDKIPGSENKYCVVEGIAADVDDTPVKIKQQQEKTILYTGTIQKFAGILDLIDAFKMLQNPEYRLIICGSGLCENEMLEMISSDNRIIFKGSVPKQTVLALQKEATLLANPRKPSVSLTRYSFPSKTMEYLASGTPMLGYKLEGIPEEYFSYIITPDGEDNESLSRKIDETLKQTPEHMMEVGQRAKNFIRERKTPLVQVRQIIDFISK